MRLHMWAFAFTGLCLTASAQEVNINSLGAKSDESRLRIDSLIAHTQSAPNPTPEQESKDTKKTDGAPESEKKPEAKSTANAESLTNEESAILSKYFGAGIFANVDLGWKHQGRVKSARVVNGVVRVEESSNSQLGFLLEAHKFFNTSGATGRKSFSGPFIGLVMEDSVGIGTGIIGYMWGFRTTNTPNNTSTMNIGLGMSISPKAQILGDGIEANQPLPAGETEVRYKKVTKYGLAVTVSFGF